MKRIVSMIVGLAVALGALQAQNTVTVTTADEFLASIAPNTEIIVDAELIDWSTANGYGKTNGEYYRWEDPFDGPELIITGLGERHPSV